MKTIASLFIATLLAVVGTASAQNVINADIASAQVTVKRDSQGFSACGVRVVTQVITQKHAETYDFSLNLDVDIFKGTLKAGKYNIPGTREKGWDVDKRKTVLPAPSTFWFAEQSSDYQLRPAKVMKANDAGFTLGIADFQPTAETIMSILQGQPVQMALRYPADNKDRVVSFRADATQEDKDAFVACMAGLTRRVERQASGSTLPAK